VHDWDTFVKRRTSSVVGIAPFGQWCSVTCRARDIGPEPRSYDFSIMLLRKEVVKFVMDKLEELLEKCGSLNQLLEASQVQWDHKTENIWAQLMEDVRDTHYRLKVPMGFGRVYFEESEHFWKQAGDKDSL